MITTVKCMKLLMQKNGAAISVMIPMEMKKLIAENAKKNSMIESQYIKLAIVERFEKDQICGLIDDPIQTDENKLVG